MQTNKAVAPSRLPEARGEMEKLLTVDDIIFAVILTLTVGLIANL